MTPGCAVLHKSTQLLLIDKSMAKARFSLSRKQIVKGDTKSLSIACASLVAKYIQEDRDEKLDEEYPEFGFANTHRVWYSTTQVKVGRTMGTPQNTG